MKCKYFDCGWCCAPIDVVTSASSCGSCIYPEHCPEITNQLPEVMSSGTAIISDENGVPTKVHLSDKEKLTEMTKKMDSVESIEAQIKMLQSKLEFYKELEKTPSPVEKAYKDWYGTYPTDGIAFDNSWDAFQAGYNSALINAVVDAIDLGPAKDKVSLYKRFENEGAYGTIKYEKALKVVDDFLMDEGVIEYEDEEYVTFKLQKSLLEIPND